MVLLVWLVAVVPAQPAPIDLHEKIGVRQDKFPMRTPDPCDSGTGMKIHRTVMDEIDRPLVVAHEVEGRCMVATGIRGGYFSADDEGVFVHELAPQVQAMIPGTALFGSLLLLTGWATRRISLQRHRQPVVRKTPGRRRRMACI